MEQSLCEANGVSAIQEIPGLSWNQKVYCLTQSSPCLQQLDQIHSLFI
jgi:hypothetical protein